MSSTIVRERFFPTVVIPDGRYPTSDGRPMAETDFHRIAMNTVIETLIARYADRPDVYVTGNVLVYYEEGNKRRHVAPDCFVVFGVPNYNRPYFQIWNEEKAPDVVFEITSASTRKEDLATKMNLYRDVLKVEEYFLFDPKQEYLSPSLQGYRLNAGVYEPIEPDSAGRLVSERLGLHLERDDWKLRFWDPVTQARLLTAQEQNDQLKLEIAQLRAAKGNGHSPA